MSPYAGTQKDSEGLITEAGLLRWLPGNLRASAPLFSRSNLRCVSCGSTTKKCRLVAGGSFALDPNRLAWIEHKSLGICAQCKRSGGALAAD